MRCGAGHAAIGRGGLMGDTGKGPAANLLAQLRREFAPLSEVPGLWAELRTAGEPPAAVLGDSSAIAVEPLTLPVDPKQGIELIVGNGVLSAADRALLETAARNIVARIQTEKREELILDELASNWEILEAMYEISAEVQRYEDIGKALKRLLTRFISLQEGLSAALYLTRSGRLQPVAGDARETLEWRQIGAFEKPIRGAHPVAIDRQDGDGAAGPTPWSACPRAAAAPLTAPNKVIGMLVAWRKDTRFEFGAPFMRLLQAIAQQASILLESDRKKRITRENERWTQEIEIASSIQQTLLFGKPPRRMPGIDMAAYSAASQRIDGDFHDFLKHSDQCVDVLVGDVMGKGIAAALLGAATKNQFLRAITSLAIRSHTGPPAPAAIVARAAGRVVEQLVSLERFVTLCYARFDLKRRVLEYVDCGHTGILLHRKQTGETRFLRGDDLPVGVLPRFTCSQHAATMLPGDTYLLFSDGVTETRNGAGEFFGEENLVECVGDWSSLGATVLVQQIRVRAAEFSEGLAQADDFTCIAVTIQLDESAPAIQTCERGFACDVQELSAMREWVADCAALLPGTAAERAGLGDLGLERMELACTEIFVNCVRHGQLNGSIAPVRFAALAYPTHLRVEIRHDGMEFNPLSIPPPSFDGSRDGGFGMYIVFRTSDEMSYRRDGETNVISVSVLRRARE